MPRNTLPTACLGSCAPRAGSVQSMIPHTSLNLYTWFQQSCLGRFGLVVVLFLAGEEEALRTFLPVATSIKTLRWSRFLFQLSVYAQTEVATPRHFHMASYSATP